MMLQIHPIRKIQQVSNWRSPTKMFRQHVPTLPAPSWPGLPQQNTEKPATIVPIPGRKMLRMRHGTAAAICRAGIACLHALGCFSVTTTVVTAPCCGCWTTVVMILNSKCTPFLTVLSLSLSLFKQFIRWKYSQIFSRRRVVKEHRASAFGCYSSSSAG